MPTTADLIRKKTGFLKEEGDDLRERKWELVAPTAGQRLIDEWGNIRAGRREVPLGTRPITTPRVGVAPPVMPKATRAPVVALPGQDVPEWQYNPPEVSIETKGKDILLDATRVSLQAQVGHGFVQWATAEMPLFLARSVTPERLTQVGPEMQPLTGPIVEQRIKELEPELAAARQRAIDTYVRNEKVMSDWWEANPQLKPRPEWDVPWSQASPEVKRDPAYWAYIAAKNSGPTIATMAAVAGGSLIGQPWLGLAASGIISTAIETDELFSDLTAHDIDPQVAAKLAVFNGAVIGLIEQAGDIPLLTAISPTFRRAFTKNISQELSRAFASRFTQGVGKTFEIVLSETVTEDLQGIVANAAAKAAGIDRSLIAGLKDTTIETAIATLIPGAVGGVASTRPGGLTGGLEAIGEQLKKGEEGFAKLPGQPEKQPTKAPTPKEVEMPIEVQREQITRGQADLDMLPPERVAPNTIVATNHGFVGTDAQGKAALVVQITQEEGGKLTAGNVVAREDLSKLATGRLLKKLVPEFEKLGIVAPKQGLSPEGAKIAQKLVPVPPSAPPTDRDTFTAQIVKETQAPVEYIDKSWRETKYVSKNKQQSLVIGTKGIPAGVDPENFVRILALHEAGHKRGTETHVGLAAELEAWTWAINKAKEYGVVTTDIPKILRIVHPEYGAQAIIDKIAPPKFVSEVVAAHGANDGSTFNLKRGDMVGKPFYAVSTQPTRNQVLTKKTVTKTDIENYIVRNYDLLSQNEYSLGTWYDKARKVTELDVVETVASRDTAIYLAQQANQRAIFDLKKMEELAVTPTGEVTSASRAVNELRSLSTGIANEVQTVAKRLDVKNLPDRERALVNQTLGMLKKEMSGFNKKLKSFESRYDVTDETIKLRQVINAFVAHKGLTKTQTQAIYKSVTGVTRLTAMSEAQLESVLTTVKQARPTRIKGNRVVTEKSERKLNTLMSTLTNNKGMTPESLTDIMQGLGVYTTKYESAYSYITEADAHKLTRALLEDADFIRWEQTTQADLAANPGINESVEKLAQRLAKEAKVAQKALKLNTVYDFLDVKYFIQSLERMGSKGLWKAYLYLAESSRRAAAMREAYLRNLLHSTPNSDNVLASADSMRRIDEYLNSKHYPNIEAPALTADELAVAQQAETDLGGSVKNTVRRQRFEQSYFEHDGNPKAIKESIPDAPQKDITQAVDIYESYGAEELRKFLDTKTWGVFESGYDPRSVTNRKIKTFELMPTTIGKSHIKTRHGVQYEPQDTSFIQRYSKYWHQLWATEYTQPAIRRLLRVYEANMPNVSNTDQTANDLKRFIERAKGYREDIGTPGRILGQLYSHFMQVLTLNPRMSARDALQNVIQHPDRHLMPEMWAGSKWYKGTEASQAYYRDYVTQKLGMMTEYFNQDPLSQGGYGKAMRWLMKINTYPKVDEFVLRHPGYSLRLGRVRKALAKFNTTSKTAANVQQLLYDAGIDELEAVEQQHALELLATPKVDLGIMGIDPVSGEEAMAMYVARETVNNVNFRYVSSEKSMADMSPSGRLILSLATYPRGYAQRAFTQLRKLDPRIPVPTKERIHVVNRYLVPLLVSSFIFGELYRRLAGGEDNPYSPFEILAWAPGGLQVSGASDIANFVSDLYFGLIESDETALNRAATAAPSIARIAMPFYSTILNTVESLTETRGADKKLMRDLVNAVDKEGVTNDEAYRYDRDWVGKMQHAIFGGEPGPQASLTHYQTHLGKYWRTEEGGDDLAYTTRDFGAQILKQTKERAGVKVDRNLMNMLKAEGGYTPLVEFYANATKDWESQYYSIVDTPTKSADTLRREFRQSTKGRETELNLLFWGKLTEGINYSNRSLNSLKKLADKYEVPYSAIPALIEKGYTYPEKSKAPASATPTTPTTPPMSVEERMKQQLLSP